MSKYLIKSLEGSENTQFQQFEERIDYVEHCCQVLNTALRQELKAVYEKIDLIVSQLESLRY